MEWEANAGTARCPGRGNGMAGGSFHWNVAGLGTCEVGNEGSVAESTGKRVERRKRIEKGIC